MPNCPHCHGFYFGNPDTCPDCNYNFRLGRVVSQEERRRQQEEEQRWRNEEIQRKNEALQRQQEQELAIRANRSRVLESNPRYEYRTEFLRDNYGGVLNKNLLDETLNKYASEGWRLHSMTVNEAGKNSMSFNGVGTNATMDVTILIFERCVKPAEY